MSERASSHYVHTEYLASILTDLFFFLNLFKFFNFMKVQAIFEVNIKAELLKNK